MHHSPVLWFPAYAGMTVRGWLCCLVSPSAPSVRHWDRLWSSLVKGEGILCRLVCLVVTRATLPLLWIADQVRNDVTPFPALWIPAYAGMTAGFAKVSIKGEGILLVVLSCSPAPLIPLPSRERGILSVVLSCCMPRAVDTALKPV